MSLFAALTLPHFQIQNLQTNPFPHGVEGIFAAIPFAIWFFLGMEGLANVAEETIEPQKNITKGFAYSMGTLGILAALTFCAAVGVLYQSRMSGTGVDYLQKRNMHFVLKP